MTSVSIFQKVTNVKGFNTKFELQLLLNDIYDILECSIADFLESYDKNHEVIPTQKQYLNDPFQHVCGNKELSLQLFEANLTKFAQIISTRESQLFPGQSGQNIFEQLNKLEFYNNKLTQHDFLSTANSLFGAQIPSIDSYSNTLPELLNIIKITAFFYHSTPIVFLQSIFQKTFSFSKSEFFIEDGQIITNLVNSVQFYLQTTVKSSLALIQILQEIQLFSEEFCRQNSKKSLFHYLMELGLLKARNDDIDLPIDLGIYAIQAIQNGVFAQFSPQKLDSQRQQIELVEAAGGRIQLMDYDAGKLFSFVFQRFNSLFVCEDLDLSEDIDDWAVE